MPGSKDEGVVCGKVVEERVREDGGRKKGGGKPPGNDQNNETQVRGLRSQRTTDGFIRSVQASVLICA